MSLTRTLILIVNVVMISTFADAQTVKVKKESARIKGENVEGYEVELEGTVAEVNASFIKYLKTNGKVKQGDGIITISEPTLNGSSYKFPVFAVTKDKGKNATAWIGIRVADWPKDDATKANQELEKTAHEFGVKFYRDKIQLQIDESLQASQAVDKQQQKLVNENKNLNTKLEDNKREKIQLEKSLENNKLENETLLKKIEKNKHDQDSVSVVGGQIKKVVEMQKEKQRKVN
jgi:hypothetical protein